MKFKYAVFHADDFNLTPEVNRGIIEAHLYGVVKSTSVMVNLPGLDEAVELLNKYPRLDVGLHVNLTFGQPVSKKADVPSLMDDAGVFWRRKEFFQEHAALEDIRKEVGRQYELALSKGLKISHIDSHHHLHFFDSRVEQVILELAREDKLAVRALEQQKRHFYQQAGLSTNDHFMDGFYGEENINLFKLRDIVEHLANGTTEIMCHPGYCDDKLRKLSSYNDMRQKELELLKHPITLQFLNENNVKIIGYNEIRQFNP
ncbi:MAG: carbohydrate deacetylase [Vulcanimicrobiota bacterium]